MKDMTQFEIDKQKCVMTNLNGKPMPYWKFAIACHKRDLSLWAKGIKINQNFKVSDYKKYYGLKGNRKQILEQFLVIFNENIKQDENN